MDAFLDFAWKNTAVLGLFFVVYRFWLYPRKQFSFNRHFLLSGLLISVVLPFVSIKRIVQITWDPLMAQGPFESVAQTTLEKLSFEQILMVLIGAGSACVLLWILFKLAVLIRLLIQAKTIQKKRPKLLLSNAVRGPFSFINAIVFPTHLYRSEAYELMLTHEKIHVKQWHSLDILLTHIMFVFTWWNPFLWWYKKGVVENLEFLTDQLTVAATKDLKAYQYILLKQTVPLDHLSLVHPFYHSFLKKRIMMLNHENNKKNPWASVLLAPLLVGFVFAFNTEVVAQIAPPPPPVNPANGYSIPPPPPPVFEKSVVSNSKFSVNISATSSEEELKEGYKTLFDEFGVQLSFKNIKRNAAGEITGIKASFKTASGNKGVYAVSGNKPISNFIFEVSLDQNEQLTEAGFKAAKSSPKLVKGYKSSRVVVRNEDGDIVTENVYGGSDKNVFVFRGQDAEVVSENSYSAAGDSIFVIKRGRTDKDSLMVTIMAQFKKKDSLKKGRKLLKMTVEEMKKEALEMKKEVREFKIEATAFQEEVGDLLEEVDALLEEKEEGVVSGFWISDKKEVSDTKTIKDPKTTKDPKARKNQKASKNQKEQKDGYETKIVVKRKANSWTADGKNQPLYVVNGKTLEKGADIKDIDPDRIKSINVIKGQAAKEKYGDKGVNGVIEITTKKQ
ncbi:MAG: TonB-dependent receptor plug domain-containing protein [Flavobacteriaceae bacterium]|nr:TonB-dependent receptor plug domain-containing protein [Flavobacteriaceae bacterium]